MEAGYEVVCIASGIEETEDVTLLPHVLALENAQCKAQAVAGAFPNDFVIAADTVVALDGVCFGKPAHYDEAARMLHELSGRTHLVVTGVVIMAPKKPPYLFVESSSVAFRNLDETMIRNYLRSINPLDKAGGYSAQDDGGRIIKSIIGSRTNVIGLPMERLTEVLRQEFLFS